MATTFDNPRAAARTQDLLQRLAGLNLNANEVDPGTLAQLVSEAKDILALVQNNRPDDRMDQVKGILLAFMREHNLRAGHVFPVKAYQATLHPTLNPAQRDLVIPTMDSLVADGVLSEGPDYKLTQAGFDLLY